MIVRFLSEVGMTKKRRGTNKPAKRKHFNQLNNLEIWIDGI